jgi:hypothetical protein
MNDQKNEEGLKRGYKPPLCPLNEEGCNPLIEEMWEDLQHISFYRKKNGHLYLEKSWQHFPEGTDLSDIWEWFDKNHSRGVGYLLHQYKKKEMESIEETFGER